MLTIIFNQIFQQDLTDLRVFVQVIDIVQTEVEQDDVILGRSKADGGQKVIEALSAVSRIHGSTRLGGGRQLDLTTAIQSCGC